MPERGKFIVFEGGDGAGKGTQTELLAKKLRNLGYEVVVTFEPGGCEATLPLRAMIFDQNINRDTKTALLLFAADRRIHLQQVILPALKEGKVVISDRFEGSTFVYQTFDDGISFRDAVLVNDIATDGLSADIVILLDIPAEEGMRRKFAQGGKLTNYDQDNLEIHEKRRRKYQEFAKIYHNWVVIDGGKTPAEVHAEIVQILKDKGIISND